MICYKDRTYCTAQSCARFGVDCERALTSEVETAARAWWGPRNGEPPICIALGRLDCYEKED